MKKAWRVISVIVLIAVLLGAVSIGVGFMTGADTERIFSVLDGRYSIGAWISYFTRDIPAYIAQVVNSLFFNGQATSGVTVEIVG